MTKKKVFGCCSYKRVWPSTILSWRNFHPQCLLPLLEEWRVYQSSNYPLPIYHFVPLFILWAIPPSLWAIIFEGLGSFSKEEPSTMENGLLSHLLEIKALPMVVICKTALNIIHWAFFFFFFEEVIIIYEKRKLDTTCLERQARER